MHWFFTFLLSSYAQKNRIIFVFINRQSDSSGEAGGAWRAGGDPQNLWTCSDRKSPGESALCAFRCHLKLCPTIWPWGLSLRDWYLILVVQPPSVSLGVYGRVWIFTYFSLLSSSFLFFLFFQPEIGTKVRVDNCSPFKILRLRQQNSSNVDSAQEQELRRWTCRSWTERKCLRKTWPANISKCSRVGRSSSSTAGNSDRHTSNFSFLYTGKFFGG